MTWNELVQKRDTVGLSEDEANEFLLLKMFRDGQEDMRRKAIMVRTPASIAMLPLKDKFDE